MNLYKTIALIGIGYMLRDQQTHKPYNYRVYDQNSVSRHLKQILNDELDLLFYGNCEWRPAMARSHDNPHRYYPYFDYTKPEPMKKIRLSNDLLDEEPYVITEEEYEKRNASIGKRTYFVYDNGCTGELTFELISDERIAKLISMELLEKARDMITDQIMYVRNEKIEMDFELIRAEGNFEINSDEE